MATIYSACQCLLVSLFSGRVTAARLAESTPFSGDSAVAMRGLGTRVGCDGLGMQQTRRGANL